MNNKARGSLMSLSLMWMLFISHCCSRNHCHICLISRSFFSLSDWKEALQLNYYLVMAAFFVFFHAYRWRALHIQGTFSELLLTEERWKMNRQIWKGNKFRNKEVKGRKEMGIRCRSEVSHRERCYYRRDGGTACPYLYLQPDVCKLQWLLCFPHLTAASV